MTSQQDIHVAGIENRDCTAKKKRNVAYLQTQLLIAQKEEAGIPLQAKEFDLMASAAAYDQEEEMHANSILMAKLQQASTSEIHADRAPVYDSDGSSEVHPRFDDNEIYNMSNQEEEYTESLEPYTETHGDQTDNSNIVPNAPSVDLSGDQVTQPTTLPDETHAYYKSLFDKLAKDVEHANVVNNKFRETNVKLTNELEGYKAREKSFEIHNEKIKELEQAHATSVYQEKCTTKKLNALHLSSAKKISELNDEITSLNKQLSNEQSIISDLKEERKKLKHDFKIREDGLLEDICNAEEKIRELDNLLLKRGQSMQTINMLAPKVNDMYHTRYKLALGCPLPPNPECLKQAQTTQPSLYNGNVLLDKHDPPTVYDSEETVELAAESRLRMQKLNKEVTPVYYPKINPPLINFVRSKTSTEMLLIPSEESSDDPPKPSVARRYLNEVKDNFVILKRVVNSKITGGNFTSPIQIEVQKIILNDINPLINQVEARISNFEIVFLKEAANFVQDFKSLAKEADESLDKINVLENDLERLSKASDSVDSCPGASHISVSAYETLQTELDCMKEKMESYVIKKDNEFTDLWNKFVKKCDECNYDKTSYEKAQNEMQQTIDRLQAQLGGERLVIERSTNVDQKEFTILQHRCDFLQKHCQSLELALQTKIGKFPADSNLQEKLSESFRELNEKRMEITDLKAQLQDNDIAISELKKLVGNMGGKTVEPKVVKSVVRQPNAYKDPKPSILGKPTPFSNFSHAKSRLPPKTDVQPSVPKPTISPYVPPPFRKPTFAKHNHVNAPCTTPKSTPKRVTVTSTKESVRSNVAVQTNKIQDAKPKGNIQKVNTVFSKPSPPTTARVQHTPNGSQPKPRIPYKQPRNWQPSMSSRVPNTAIERSAKPRYTRTFVNSKIPTTRRYNPVAKNSSDNKTETWIKIGNSFSQTKSSTMQEKTTSRSSLQWKPTGRILKEVGLKWIPIVKCDETCTSTNASVIHVEKEFVTPNTSICADSSSVIAGTSSDSEPTHSSKGSNSVHSTSPSSIVQMSILDYFRKT